MVEFHISTEVDYMNVVDAVELLLEDWEEGLCRSVSRDFLTPYTTVRSELGERPGGKKDTDVEADPQIRHVSVVVAPNAGSKSQKVRFYPIFQHCWVCE